jgi:signal transduction histidine kinase/CheY-like chemotaxis protein
LAAAIGDFDGLPIAGCVIELDGTLVAVNAASARMLARPAAQVLGKKVWDFAPGMEHIWMEILQTIRREGEARGQIAIATPLGPRHIQYVGGLRSYETRTLVLAFALEQDLPQHTAVDDVAKQRLEALGLVAGGIAHDFNNQLVSVLAEASAAREDASITDGAQEAFRRIEAAANRMAQLTRQLLAYAGRGRFVTELVDPDQLLRDAHDQLSRIVRPDAELEMSVGTRAVAVQADRGLMQQVLVNVVANASEALRTDGRIEISTRTADGWWTLQVKDTGIGMDPKTVERIFDPFFTTKPAHHGLGLSAVSGIVRRLGGELHVDSRVGYGSTFQIRLRVVENVEPKRRRAESPRVELATLEGISILVADDEPAVRTTIRRLLERRGATVVTAADGGEAAAQLREGEYALVLLDVMMPHLTGYQLLPIAREAQPKARLMLMSGYTDATRGSGAEVEPDAFLEKPFSAAVLDAAVDRLLKS